MVAELNKKDFSIIVLLLIVFVGVDVLLYLYFNNKKEITSIKKNANNTYTSIYITADKQASIYLNHYYNLINLDTEKAFEKYEKKSLKSLKTLDEFKAYLSNMNISNSKVEKLDYHKGGRYSYYSVIDGNGNKVTFKTKGVMNYTVDFR